MTNTTGHKVSLMIRRLYCPKCKRLHHELPDCVVPYKRHCTETIETIIGGIRDGLPCENRVIRRILAWWNKVQPYYLNIVKSLCEKYGIVLSAVPAFKEIVRAAANSNNWISVGLV
ncbi:MAG: DUF6431 domain-containing protein [Oscillospiraceae bacterium]|nr:DUF6431 domain-containing protein [Oscillospiraceae bacterium]